MISATTYNQQATISDRLAVLRYPRLWWALFMNCVSRDMEYRGHFFMRLLIDTVWYAVQLGLFQVIYLNVPTIAGWDRATMTIFLGTLFIVDAINMLLFSHNVWDFPKLIRNGELDFYLLKPVSPLFLTFCRYANPASFVNLLMAVTVLVIGVVSAHIQVTAPRLLLYVLMIGCGDMVMISLQIVTCGLTVFTVGGDGLQGLMHQLDQFGSRPDGIYGGMMRRVFLYIFPMALLASIPARALIGQLETGTAVWSIALSVMLFAGAWRFFLWSLKRYKGASS